MSAHREVRDFVERYQVRAKKRLGQNFLVDGATLDDIASTAARSRSEAFIEIGPGPGTLTRRLARFGRPVVAIEKDAALVAVLREEFRDTPGVTFVHGDALVGALQAHWPSVERPAVVGNIPYNISSALIVRLVEQRAHLGPVTLLMQREVVDRLLAPPGSKAYGRLSILLRLYADPERGRSVSPGCFWPPPKVQSAVIHWDWRRAPAVSVDEPSHFERVVKAAFAQRRKKLRNALRTAFGAEEVEACAAAGFDLERRAERLGLEDFAELARLLPRRATTPD